MRSWAAWSSRSSSLPKVLTKNGQVGSRNTSKMRGPWISAPCIHAIFPLPGSVHGEGPKRSRRRAPEASPGYDKMPGAGLVERQNDNARDFGVILAGQRLLALATCLPFVAEIISVDASTQTAAPNNQPSNPPFIRSGHLAAPGFSEHRIYWEEYGSLGGEPVIVMHGGPGAGSHSSSARFFNPQRYRVVLFDQRGCGKSTPSASDDDATPALTDNTTQHLIDDVLALRHELNIDGKMHVFGGSWGSTLALAYAIAHPATVQTLILRGVFLCRRADVDYFFQGNAAEFAADPMAMPAPGAYLDFPAAWRHFIDVIPPEDR